MNPEKFNIGVIAGYDVLADISPNHRDYVEVSVAFCIKNDVDMIILLGGATNPDYPGLTEAHANYTLLKEFLGNIWEICLYDKKNISASTLREIREINNTKFRHFDSDLILAVVKLNTGNTSAETLSNVSYFLTEQAIFVNKLILCCEMARCAGFSADALFEDVNQMAGTELIFFGHRFPETQKEFKAQKRKMLFKVLSHHSRFFEKLRLFWQKRHQKKVAKIKRKSPQP